MKRRRIKMEGDACVSYEADLHIYTRTFVLYKPSTAKRVLALLYPCFWPSIVTSFPSSVS